MRATTRGQGPFNPAIFLNGRMWVCPIQIWDEDLAQQYAQTVLDTILARTTEQLNKADFQPTKELAE